MLNVSSLALLALQRATKPHSMHPSAEEVAFVCVQGFVLLLTYQLMKNGVNPEFSVIYHTHSGPVSQL